MKIATAVVAALVLLADPAAAAAEAPAPALLQSALVLVEASLLRPDWSEPWAPGTTASSSGTAFVLEGGRVLTSAHVVADANFVQVRRAGDARRFPAEVRFVGHGSDLALLEVPDPAFFAGIEPLRLGELPPLGAAVTVLGFAVDGEQVAVTAGVFSRLELARLVHSVGSVTTMQIDAAVHSGNSGGPVVAGGRVVGVVLQSLGAADGLRVALPAELVRQFLEDVGDGRVDGLPDPGIVYQEVFHTALSRWLGSDPQEGGVRITDVGWGSSAAGTLRPGDHLLDVDGRALSGDGTVEFRPGERIDFSYLVERRQAGETMPVTFRRGGERRTATLRLAPGGRLVPRRHSAPPYLMLGGVVFQPLTWELIVSRYGKLDKIPNDLRAFMRRLPSAERKEVVVVSRVLADPTNLELADAVDEVVVVANGRPIASLADLAAALASPRGGFHVIEFGSGAVIVIDPAEADSAKERILTRYGLPADRSSDLRSR